MSIEKPTLHFDDDTGRDVYEVPTEKHPKYEHYQPRLLSIGGEHIVYGIENHPKIVFKVSKILLKQYLSPYLRSRDDVLLRRRIEKGLEERCQQERVKLDQLAEYFGQEHLVREKINIVPLPLSQEMIGDILGQNEKNIPEMIEVPIVARIQRAVDLKSSEVLDIQSGYAENKMDDNEVSKTAYREGSTLWTRAAHDTDRAFDGRLLERAQKSTSLGRLLVRLEKDGALRAEVTDFVRKAITLSQETGGILDLAGTNNVIITPKDKAWLFQILDGVYADKHDSLIDEAKKVLFRVGMTGEGYATADERILLKNVLNYTRTINALAHALGLPDRVVLVDSDMEERGVDWERVRGKLVDTHL